MQLWTRMAQQQHAAQLGAPASNAQHPTPLSGLAAGLRPHYFAKPAPAAFKPAATMPAASPKDAMLVAMASQTLIQRLGSAFWDAFSGTPPSPSPSSLAPARAPACDPAKVR